MANPERRDFPQQEAQGPGRLKAAGAFPVGTGGKGRPAPTHRRRGGRARAAPAPSSPPCRRSGWRTSRGRGRAPSSAGASGRGEGTSRTGWPQGALLLSVPVLPLSLFPQSVAHALQSTGLRGGAWPERSGAERGGAGGRPCGEGSGRARGRGRRRGGGAERGAGEPVRGFPGPPAYSWPAARGATLPAWAKGVLSAPHPRKWVLPATPGAARIWRPPPTRNTSAARR